jgi:hypothetical protein
MQEHRWKPVKRNKWVLKLDGFSIYVITFMQDLPGTHPAFLHTAK